MGLRLTGRKCLVVGGGTVAARKVAALVGCGADVHVVSPTFGEALAADESITRHASAYDPALLDGAALVIAATDDEAVNRRVAEDAWSRGILVNVVDTPSLCDFYCPAVVRRGPLAIAIHSGGAAPALARRLRQQLEREFGPAYEALAEALGRLRREIIETVDDPVIRSRRLRRLGEDETIEAFFRHGADALRRAVFEEQT